jgi:hypothetical protein
MGWDFAALPIACPGWEIVGGNLQIKDFSTFNDGICAFTLPPIDIRQPPYSQYNVITLALMHHVDLDPGNAIPNQSARIYFDGPYSYNLVTQITNTLLEQQMALAINVQKLPVVSGNVYQWFLEVKSLDAENKGGWQISSLAIMGNR